MMLWNFNGAAIMQPLYFYILCRSQARVRDPTIPVNESKAIFLTTFAILLSPLLIFAPAWAAGTTTWDHHGYLAMFHYSPIVVTALFLAAARILPAGAPEQSAAAGGSREAYRASREPKRWIVASLALAGIVAAAAHVYVVVGALVTRDPDASLARLFVPVRGTADPIGTLPASLASLAPEHAALLENFHLFSQYDWYVVSLSCVVFAHLLLSRRDGEEKTAAANPALTRVEGRELAYLSAATVLLGPGAAGSFALAIREARI
ncbi:hypothetical protein SLS62_000850 [Diatrype stigma]|uniref:Uncharacterized protein n=1 Tax=Diatrype stigma TaxID=117547 RepID=A0AAN9V3A0_9PEZI